MSVGRLGSHALSSGDQVHVLSCPKDCCTISDAWRADSLHSLPCCFYPLAGSNRSCIPRCLTSLTYILTPLPTNILALTLPLHRLPSHPTPQMRSTCTTILTGWPYAGHMPRTCLFPLHLRATRKSCALNTCHLLPWCPGLWFVEGRCKFQAANS